MSSVAVTTRESLTPERVSLARALGSSTRSSIFSHLQQADTALTVREVAAAFDLHPNVARTHLETLADAGLVEIGRRKHPGGGRPAKLYWAQTNATSQPVETSLPNGSSRAGTELLVRVLAGLTDGEGAGPLHTRAADEDSGSGPHAGGTRPKEHSAAARVHDAAAAEGRRLVSAHQARPDSGDFSEAAQVAVDALAAHAPHARVVATGDDWVDIAGVRSAFGLLGNSHAELADALARGLLAGALAAAGAAATLSETDTLPGGDAVLRARPGGGHSGRRATEPAECVDTRGAHRETGVVQAMRAIIGLCAGEVLEVLTEGPGSPAAFARWADRAGHQLLGVERAVDTRDRPAIRLLIRKGADVRPSAPSGARTR